MNSSISMLSGAKLNAKKKESHISSMSFGHHARDKRIT